MTRVPNNSDNTRTEDGDVLITEEEFEAMGWVEGPEIGSPVDRVHRIAGALNDTRVLEMKEAQAFAFREIAGASRQATADETNMSPSEVDRVLRSAKGAVQGVSEFAKILEDCNC